MRNKHLTILWTAMIATVLCGSTIALANALHEGDWTMFRGDTSLRGIAKGTLPEQPKLLWTFKTESAVVSSAVIGHGKAYIGSDDQHLYAIDLKTGKLAWKFLTEDFVESVPVLYNDAVLFGSNDGVVYCLDAAKGELRWKFAAADKVVGSPVPVKQADGKTIVLVPSFDCNLYGLDFDTGEKLWTHETDNFINATPTVADGKAIFGGCDGLLHVVDIASGKEVKAIEIADYVAGSAAYADGKIYVGHFGNEVVCLDLATDKIVWKYKDRNFPYYSSPAVTKDRVLIGGRDKQLHCINRSDGEKVWTFRTRGRVESSPVVVGDRVVFGSEDGRIYIVNIEDGKQTWSYEIGDSIASTPAVAHGIVVVGCEDGNVYAFGEKK